VSDVQVALDGAQVRTSDVIHFGIAELLRALDWLKSTAGDIWQDTYAHTRYEPKIVIHSKAGRAARFVCDPT
jgi:hypothetical protein